MHYLTIENDIGILLSKKAYQCRTQKLTVASFNNSKGWNGEPTPKVTVLITQKLRFKRKTRFATNRNLNKKHIVEILMRREKMLSFVLTLYYLRQ